MEWAFQQRIPVLKLWGDSWQSDPYGSRWVRLETQLGKENFRKAKKDLMDAGLFLFECRIESSKGEQKYCWWVKNLHGCRTDYWKNAQKKGDSNNLSSEFHTEEVLIPQSDCNLKDMNTEFHTEKPSTENQALQLSLDFSGANTAAQLDELKLRSDILDSSNDVELVENFNNQQDLHTQHDVEEDVHSYIDKTLWNSNEVKDSVVNIGGGAYKTKNGAVSRGVGNHNTTLEATNTTLDSVNALVAGVSKVLKNISETSYEHFRNSLNIQGRQEFINFCLEKIHLLKKVNFEVRTWDAWIARHYEQYMNEWRIFSSTRQEEPKRTSLDEFNSWRSELLEKEKRAKEERMRRRQQLQTA
jgi:hypothetical protein